MVWMGYVFIVRQNYCLTTYQVIFEQPSWITWLREIEGYVNVNYYGQFVTNYRKASHTFSSSLLGEW